MESLQNYLKLFGNLKRGVTKYGKAPHKVVMLLSVLQSIKNVAIRENRIFITPELVLLFKSNWSSLVNTEHVCNFALPFFHLKGEGFWHLVPKSGFETVTWLNKSLSSFGEVNAAIEYVYLDNDLFALMQDSKTNGYLQQF